MEAASDSAKNVLIIALVFQVLMNTVFSGPMMYYISMINLLQFIFHTPIMSIIHPANVMSFFNIMIPIVMFDVLSDVPLFQPYFEDSVEPE